MAKAVSVAIVGARTVRQGTGPWFAKHFAAAGADVCALLGTNADSANSAQQELHERFGLNIAAFCDWDKLLAEANPDLIAIASPADTHLEYLWKTHAAGKAAFVEKPFVWDSERDNVSDTQELVSAFENARLPVFVNTQWLDTLNTFRQLYPDCDMENISRFEMHLSPTSSGTDMLVDALPHAWSMLCHLAGAGEISRLETTASANNRLTLEGVYEGQQGATRFRFGMQSCAEQPRPFAYSINNCRVDREIDLADYSMSFRTDTDTAPLRDPLAARISRILTLIPQNAYNSVLPTQVLETRLLEQSIEAVNA